MGLYDQAVSFASDLARQQAASAQSSPSTLGLGPDFSSLMQYLVGQAQRRPIGRALVTDPLAGGQYASNLATQTGQSFVDDARGAQNYLVDQGVANTVNAGRSALSLFQPDDQRAVQDSGIAALSPTGGNQAIPSVPADAQAATSGNSSLQYSPAMLNALIGRPTEITPPNYAPPSQADFGPPASLAGPNAVHQAALNSALAQSALPQDFRQAIAGSNANPQDVQDVYGSGRGAGAVLQGYDTDANIAQLRSNLDTAKARLAANPRDIAAETATIQLQHELDRKTAPGGQHRLLFENEAPQENAARAAARPISDDPAVQAHLASLGFTPSGGTMENRGGVQVEVPLSRNFADLSPEQAYGIQAAGGLPYSDPKLQAARIQSDALDGRAIQDALARQAVASIKADADIQKVDLKAAQPDFQLIHMPNGQVVRVDKKQGGVVGDPIGDARAVKPSRSLETKLFKFGKGDEGLYATEEIIPPLHEIGVDDGGEVQDAANEAISEGDNLRVEKFLSANQNVRGGLLVAASRNPAVRAQLMAYKTANPDYKAKAQWAISKLTQAMASPTPSATSGNPIDDL